MSTPFKKIVNKYPGTCACGTAVSATSGFAVLAAKGAKWETTCSPCVTGSTPTPAEPTDKRPTFPLTEEQRIAVDLFSQGQSIAIQAGAGTGKTSTLVAIAKSTTRTGRFVAFNKAIVVDAGAKLPKNVTASTAHSLAYQQVGKLYRHRLDSPRQSSQQIARRLGLDPFIVQIASDERRVIQPSTLAGYVMKAVTTFCNSADKVPSGEHMSYVDGIDAPTEDGNRTYSANRALRKHCASAIAKAWADIQQIDGQLRFNPDNYLKIWELGLQGAPVIPGEFILFDEAQDASPVLLSVVEQQNCQVVFVGDAQQAIYEWRGAVDAMSTVPAESTCFLTNSFRFGPEVAAVANKVLSMIESAELRLTGRGAAGTIEATTAPDAVLTRTNAGAIGVVLQALAAGRTPHLVGGGGEMERFAKAAQELLEGRTTDHPELCIFETWKQVQEYAEMDELGGELAPMVKLIDDHGIETILKAVGNTVDEEDADVVVSTAHKSKGREWDSVQLANDFPTRMNESEYRLLYVAVTRARLLLDIESCDSALEVLYPGRTSILSEGGLAA